MTKKVKILVAYHKPSELFKDEVLTPIHLGRALGMEKNKDGSMSEQDYEWLCENMIGDDTGDNISHLNHYFNELSGIYWAWKNYDKLGDPDYIGLSQYRRHFIFDENFKTPHKFLKYHPVIEHICDTYRSVINILDFNYADYDLIIPNKYKIKVLKAENLCDYNAINAITSLGLSLTQKRLYTDEKFKKYKFLAKNLKFKNSFYACNMFVMKKEIFFEYCEFLFSIIFPLYEEMKEQLANSNSAQKRELGYLAEQLTSLFIEKSIEEGRKTKEFQISFIQNTTSAKFQDSFNLNAVKKLLHKHEVISFDLFDTLLVRPYAKPHDVFRHLEQECKGFFKLRSKAEFKAMKILGKKQVNLDEIYSQIPSKFHFLKEKEKQLELQTLYVNPFCKTLYEEAKKLGRRIIFVSDMYHSKEFITEILTKNGICDYEKLYVSSELGKTKYHKDLYEHILEELNINSKEMLHIGDNELVDFKNAKDLGISAFYIPKPLESFFKDYPRLKEFDKLCSSSLTSSVILGLCLKKWLLCGKEINEYWKVFGYFYGGAICYGLSKFIFDKALSLNLKEMIFIARDGYAIEKIFNFLQKHFAKEDIKTHYIQASRSLANKIMGLDLLTKNFGHKLRDIIISFKDFVDDFKNIGDYELFRDSANFQFQESHLKLVLKNKEQIEKLMQEKYNLYQKYLQKFNLTNDKAGIFDFTSVSFRVEKIFKKCFPKKTFISFYWYVGISKKPKFIHTFSPLTEAEHKVNGILEFLITAPDFSASDINEDLSFKKEANFYEQLHIELYKNFILDEILEFSKDLLRTFGNFELSFEYEILKRHIEVFQYNINYEDKMAFTMLYKALDDASLRYVPIINLHTRKHFGAGYRTRNHLAYKLGSCLVKAKSFKSLALLPFRLIFICLAHLIDIRVKKALKLPSLDCYADYLESFKVKKHLSYRLGSAMLKNPLSFLFKISKIYQAYKDEK